MFSLGRAPIWYYAPESASRWTTGFVLVRAHKMKIVTFLIVGIASVAIAEDFKLLDGKEYKNATVSRVEPDGIVLVTGSGISKVYFTELPKEVRDRFNFNPMKAAAYTARQNASEQAAEKQREEARRKLAEQNNKYWIAQGQAGGQKSQPGALTAPMAGQAQRVEVITHGAPVDITRHLVPGHVTIVDFYADWCGPCRQLSPSLEQMAQTDPEIALRKIDIVNWNTAVAQQYNIHSIPQVNIYNRAGDLVGTVTGANFENVKRYVAQAKTGG